MSDDKAWFDAEHQQLATLAEIERGLEERAASQRGDVTVSDVIDRIWGRPTFFAAEIDVLTEPADAAAEADRMLSFLQRPWRYEIRGLEVGPLAVDDLSGQAKPNVYGSLAAKMPAVGASSGGCGDPRCANCGGSGPNGCGRHGGGGGAGGGLATGGAFSGGPGPTGPCYASVTIAGDITIEFAETDAAENAADTILVEGIGHPPMSAVQALAMWLGEATDKGWSLPAGDVVTAAGRVVDADGALQDLVNAIERFRCYGPKVR